ncbi:MAG: hypothetical protein ACOZQL_39490 [Myxococcota bacterium]
MHRLLVVALSLVVLGCGSPSGTDAGTGGATGGGAATGGGGASGGGGGTTGGGGGGSTPWDGGSSGTLVGPDAIDAGWVTSGFQSFDGGVGDARRFSAMFFDQRGVSACTSPTPPFSTIEVRVQLADAGVVTPGVYALDYPSSFVSRIDYTPLGMATDVGGFGTTGTITITRLDARSSAGSFTTTLTLFDGGTAPLSGTWDTGHCQ